LQLDPKLVEGRLALANVARYYQRYDEARRTYEAVILEHPNHIQARFGLELTEESDGWPSRAVAQYEVERRLNEYEPRGVTAPAFGFHRARVLALRGDTARALAALQAAVDRGWRRAWWVRRDPAFERLRSEAPYVAMLQQIDAQVASQRSRGGDAATR
jgi:tetratricopeptide (TPR) repeat protein